MAPFFRPDKALALGSAGRGSRCRVSSVHPRGCTAVPSPQELPASSTGAPLPALGCKVPARGARCPPARAAPREGLEVVCFLVGEKLCARPCEAGNRTRRKMEQLPSVLACERQCPRGGAGCQLPGVLAAMPWSGCLDRAARSSRSSFCRPLVPAACRLLHSFFCLSNSVVQHHGFGKPEEGAQAQAVHAD
jgi:hypothetical protein